MFTNAGRCFFTHRGWARQGPWCRHHNAHQQSEETEANTPRHNPTGGEVGNGFEIFPLVHEHDREQDQNVDGGDAIAIGEGAQANAAAAVPDTEIVVEEDVAKAFLFDAGVSLSDLVDAINAVGATPSDLVAILEALREAGALNAELIVI